MKTLNYFNAKRRVGQNYLGICGVNDLNKFLSLKRNELKMLEKTYDEACDKKGGNTASILYEIERLQEDIKVIEEDILNLETKTLDEDSKVERKPIERRKRTKYRCENLKEEEEKPQNPHLINAQNYVDDLAETANDRLMANHFLVSFSSALPVSELMVRGVEFLDNNSLQVSIYDHVVDNNGNKKSLIEILEHLKDNGSNIPVTLKHVDAYGVTVYEELYPLCKIGEIFRTPFDYSNQYFSFINVNFHGQVPKVYK